MSGDDDEQGSGDGGQGSEKLPPALVAMLRDALGERADAVLAGMAAERQPAFRANTLKGRTGDLRAELAAAGVPFAPHPLSDWSFTTTVAGEALLKATPAYLEGRLYSQGLASQLPALLGTLREGSRVLDACAAPGGKATLLAMRLGDGGRGLTACERAAVRMQKLEHTLRMQGADRVRALHCDTREPPETVTRVRWDHILVDAPCSGSGTFDADPRSWRHLAFSQGLRPYGPDGPTPRALPGGEHPPSAPVPSLRDGLRKAGRTAREPSPGGYDEYVASRAAIQRALIERAAALLGKGGTLVYSTCSLDPRENEAVATHLLHLRAPLKPVDLSSWGRRFPGQSGPGLSAFRDAAYPPELASACLRLWPCAAHEGFFVAMFVAK